MGRTCGNCGTEMEDLGGDRHYCPNCDETFTITKGKQTVEPKKKNVLEQIKDGFGKVNERLDNLEKAQEETDIFGQK